MMFYFENAFFTNGAITARLDIINKDIKAVVIISILMILKLNKCYLSVNLHRYCLLAHFLFHFVRQFYNVIYMTV